MKPEDIAKVAGALVALIPAIAAFVKMIEYEVEYYENGQPKKRRLKIRFRKNPPDADKAAKMLGISVSDIIGIKQVSPYPKNTFGLFAPSRRPWRCAAQLGQWGTRKLNALVQRKNWKLELRSLRKRRMLKRT